jgi:hypothetical protein
MDFNGISQNKPDALIVKRTSFKKRHSEVPNSAIDSAKEIMDSIPDALSTPKLKAQVEGAKRSSQELSTPKAARESTISNPNSPVESKKAKKYEQVIALILLVILLDTFQESTTFQTRDIALI